MDAQTILKVRPELTRYLHEFDDCFGRVTTRRHLDTYVAGQLSDLQRKSIEPMADAAGVPPRTLQQLLSLYRWDERMMRDRLAQRVARRHGHPHSIGVLDETSFLKKGEKTACVQRQHCGSVGKLDNCVVSVHLGYATPEFHCLLDGELYLPEGTWDADRERCREAGIPDDVVYRSKWQIGLGQIRRARANGIRFQWMTFDEGYGGKPAFLRELDGMGQNYVGEAPAHFTAWTRPPEVLYREHARSRMGRPRKLPRLKVKNNPPVAVKNIATHSPAFRRDDWQTYHVKDGAKGPMLWQAKCIPVWLPDADGLPGAPHLLLVTRPVTETDQKVKYFISNAPEGTPNETLLLVAFSRWKIERAFQDTKDELGMDHFEVRKFRAISRHLILSCVSYLFLAEFHQKHRKKKSGADGVPGPHGDRVTGAGLASWRSLFASVGRVDQPPVAYHPATQRPGGRQPPQTQAQAITRVGAVSEGHTNLFLVKKVAL
jgi:SRSO17 transposase